MALSETVKTSLREAQENLKDALACAARTEKPFVSKHIADMLAQIDNLIDATEMLEKMQNRIDGDSGFFGTFFNPDALCSIIYMMRTIHTKVLFNLYRNYEIFYVTENMI